MTDIVLKDIDPELRSRIERVARAEGWSVPEALSRLLDAGLRASEHLGRSFDDREQNVLAEAVAALEEVPDDPGFASIGRVAPGEPAPHQLFK
jgi:hypothetical protein